MKFFRLKIAIFSTVLLVGLTILFWDSILTTLFTSYFKNYFRRHFGAEIAIEKIHRKKNGWTLTSPFFDFPGGDLTAKQIAVAYEPYLWKRKVEVRVKIIEPMFKLTDQSLALLDGLKKMEVGSGLIDYHFFVEVENGCAVADHLPPLYFNLSEELGPHSQCHFQGGFSSANQVQGFYLFQDDQHPKITLSFNDFDLMGVSKWMEHLQPGAMEWTSQGGRVEGTWIVDEDYHYGAGDLKVTDLTLTSMNNPFTMHIPSLSTVKEDGGTVIVLEKKGKLEVQADQDVTIDLYHFGGELYLSSEGEFQGVLAGAAAIGTSHPELEVEVEVDQLKNNDLFHYTVKGPLKAFLSQLPQKYEHVLETDFAEARAHLKGKCTPIEKGVEFNTDVKLFDKEQPILDDLHIYCRVDPSTPRFIDEGNFIASNVDLKKIVSPFLFVDKQFELKGNAYFEGTWDPALMEVRYQPFGAVLESDSLSMNIPERVESDEVGVKQFPGEHFVDFERNHQYGRLYVENGFYLEKRTGLLFSNLNTQIVFEGKTLHATQVQTVCQGICFEGGIGLDYSSPLKKTFNLDINIEKMEGKVSQFQDFLSHFPQPLLLQRLPFEGKIMNGRGDNKISLQFITGKCTIEADIQGVLVDGHTSDPAALIRADQLSFEFAYSHDNKTLGLKNLGGFLRMGKPETEKVFRLQGEGLQFKNYMKHEGDFSIALRDDRHEWIRLAGDIFPVQAESKEDWVRVTFDPGKSHLQDGQAIHCICEISDWESVEDLDLSFQLKVPGVIKELQQGIQCGLIEIPEPFVEQINEWGEEGNSDGQLFVKVGYDKTTSLFNIQGRGKQIQLGDHSFDQVNLEAKKRHHTWMIEQLQFDDLSLSADLHKGEADWKLNFLGLRWGEALLAGLEGSFIPADQEIKAKINLFELDLLKALSFPKLKEYIAENAITGELKGVGELSFKLTDKAPGWCCDVLGNLNSRSVSFKDIALEDANNVSFHLLSDKTIALRNLKTKALGVEWHVEKCSYSPKVGELEMENVAFSYPVAEGTQWTGALEKHCPDLMDNPLKETILGLKSEGVMEGFFDFSLSENIHQFTLRLKDDTYSWKKEPYEIKNFSLVSKPTEKTFLFQTPWMKALPWVYLKTGNGEKGIVVISEQNPLLEQENDTSKHMTIEWKNPANMPVVIESVSGSAFGIGANLEMRGNDYAGFLSFQLPAMAPMLTEEHLQAVQKAQFKGTYLLDGAWNIPFQEKEWFKQIHFNGHLTGSGCALKGYCYDGFEGECILSPEKFTLTNCHISDMAFDGSLANLMISFEQDPSQFQLTMLQLHNLRPHLIKKDQSEESFGKKNLNFNLIEITECSGTMGDPDTYLGNGYLTFSTQMRKGIESTPFALPAEILSRIGLSSAIMTPVSGTALFQIGHGRCYINKLKDTYSQGKLSKFYIHSSKEPSYIDFDGNVHVQVRIKHYNLLFKLSEMLPINIRGTVSKPIYYLQKQPK